MTMINNTRDMRTVLVREMETLIDGKTSYQRANALARLAVVAVGTLKLEREACINQLAVQPLVLV